MSRIGKNPINIPEGVEVFIEDGEVAVKGAQGELRRSFRNEIGISKEDRVLKTEIKKSTRLSKALWGTYASHLRNMLEGVAKGFEKKLVLEGIGYRAEVQDKKLVLRVGFSHSVEVEAPQGISFRVDKNTITISGADKELVGQTAARTRAVKKPEPYKGKGIRYENEIVRRKAGKKAAAAT